MCKACLLALQLLVVELRCLDTADGKHRIEALTTAQRAVRLLRVAVEDMGGDLTDALGVKERLAVVGTTQHHLILLLLDGLEARAYIIIVDLELQHLLITYRVGDDVVVELLAEDTRRRLIAESVRHEDGRTREAKLIVVLEALAEHTLPFAEL